MASWL